MTNTTQRNQNRGGFTLIELLMVVTVIAVLMTLSVLAMNGVTEQAEIDATTTTILKVNSLLEERIEAFDRAFKGPRRDTYVQSTVALLRAINGRFDYFRTHPDEAPPAIRMLAYKAAFRFEVPQRIVEMNIGGGATPALPGLAGTPIAVSDPTDGLPMVIYTKLAVPIARQQLIEAGTASPTALQINQQVTINWNKHVAHEDAARLSDLDDIHSTESAEILYFILTQSATFGATTSAAEQFTSTEIEDTDEDGFPEFVDAWGNPLQFYRWPTRLFDPTAPNPFAPDFANPNDPTEQRQILSTEREHAGLLVKGLPPSPFAIGSATQRDLLLVDPDDPVGILYTFLEDPKYKAMGIDLTAEYNEAKYHTPDTFHVPLIVSAGPDGLLGLREPNRTDPASGIYGNLAQYAGTTATSPSPTPAVVDTLFDNLTSRNRRAGARK